MFLEKMDGMLEKNLVEIQKKIEEFLPQGLDLPRIIAVSKRQPQSKIQDLFQLGIKDFAENYLQEAKVKIENFKNLNITWHYIGRLQKKKIKDIVGKFEWIHTLDRIDVAEKISEHAVKLNIQQKVLVQVNIAEEESKQGVKPGDFVEFIENVKRLKNIDTKGIMVFPPLCDSESESLDWFERGRNLILGLPPETLPQSPVLSMGTSNDYHLAIQKGGNFLRVGESLMGARINLEDR